MIPLTALTIMQAADVAARLGWSRSHFLRKRTALEAQGFPAMLPGAFGRWSTAAVERWIVEHDEIRRIAEANLNQPVRIAFDRARLTRLYAGGAHA